MDRKITEGENLIYKVKNDFKSLNENDEYLDIINSLKNCDEILEAAKSFYNKYTTEINLLIKKFPTNIIAIIPIIILAIAVIPPNSDLKPMPIKSVERPKKSKLTPTITETNSDENIGNIMNIKPKIIEIIPTVLFKPIMSPPFLLI